MNVGKSGLPLVVLLVLATASLTRGAEPNLQVETWAAGSLGTTSLTANGRIQPHGLPTRYAFEFGPTTAYGSKTAESALPPRLAAHYLETWNQGLAGWLGGMNGKDLKHHPGGGTDKGFVRFSEPSGDDPNHIDGIGTLHLSSYFYPGTLAAPGSAWGGGAPDLRDARVQLRVRGNDWVPNGSELVWWTQSDSDLSQQFSPDWRRANWAYTGYSLNDFLGSGRWETVDYRLRNTSEDWTYGGNNLAQKRPNYHYWSIDKAQSNLNCDFFHLLAFIDPANRPQGTLDLDDLHITYRNQSLVFPSNGGKLTASPAGSTDAPALLTDGWRHGAGGQWASAAEPKAPLEFVYEFAKPVTITTVQLHQHTDWPSREVEVLVSSDGEAWSSLLTTSLPENSPQGPNFTHSLKRNLSASARHCKVRILSGYRAEHWGLGEIELFGTGAECQTDDDWYHVNLDLESLSPGQTVHYRLVATNAEGTVTGADQIYVVPQDAKPLVTSSKSRRVGSTAATLTGRLNPLGEKTRFHFEYGTTSALGQRTASQYGGLQITPRSVHAVLTDLTPGTEYFYRLVAENPVGQSSTEVHSFRTNP